MEADRQKLIAIQKKTPEVTITVVNPQKPVAQRLLPKQNLPEVSILPAIAPRVSDFHPIKHANNTNKKKDKQQQQHQQQQQQQQQQHQQSNTRDSYNVTNKSKTKTGATVPPMNPDFVVRGNVTSKQGSKSDKSITSKITKANSQTPVTPVESGTPDVPLTKKERKKLRREIRKLEEAKANEPEQQPIQQSENQPQIVTIKRVMESNSAEPTVTITLKGQTPAQDKVLFTLVNGQTKEQNSSKSEQAQSQSTSGKKKKGKGNSRNNLNNGTQIKQQQQQQQQEVSTVAKSQQPASAGKGKSQGSQKANETKTGKQQQSMNEKLKGAKVAEKKPQQQQSQLPKVQQQQKQELNSQRSIPETKSTKSSKKDKKNAEPKQTVINQITINTPKNKNTQQQPQQQGSSKNQNKSNATQQAQQASSKGQQMQNTVSAKNGKKLKGQQQLQQQQESKQQQQGQPKQQQAQLKQQQQTQPKQQQVQTKKVQQAQPKQHQQTQPKQQLQQQQQQQQQQTLKKSQQHDEGNQTSSSKKKKNGEMSKNQTIKIESQKKGTKGNQSNQPVNKQLQQELQGKSDLSTASKISESHRFPLSSQLRDVNSGTKLNIENLKLPPGITITKVDTPAKPLPIKSAPMPKPQAVSKQTTIIAAPMTGAQSSYAGAQTGGNVIVVDTGKLKQELLPRNGDKGKGNLWDFEFCELRRLERGTLVKSALHLCIHFYKVIRCKFMRRSIS